MMMSIMNSNNSKILTLIFSLSIFLQASQTAYSQQSGCAICASTSDCSQAFHSGPGKYCGIFHDSSYSFSGTTKPCCCPNNSQCQLSSTQCNCFVPTSRSSSYHHHKEWYDFDDNDDYYNSAETAGGFVTFFMFICILCCCCRCLCHPDSTSRSAVPTGEFEPIPVAYAVNPKNGGGNDDDVNEENPPATAPNYQATGMAPNPTATATTGNVNNSGNNSGFAWGPALGGFIAGQMFSGGGRDNDNYRHHHHHHRHRNHGGGGWGGWRSSRGGGWGGGGGGFTMRGDSGGGGRRGGGGGGFTMRGGS